MGYMLRKCYVFIDTVNWIGQDREGLDLKEKDIRDFVKHNPIPKNHFYKNLDEIIKDLCKSTGTITYPFDLSEEEVDWLVKLFDYVLA